MSAPRYAVVQFLQLPYPEIDEYVCVPYHWIRKLQERGQQCLVLFPVEHPSLTKIRVETWQYFSKQWKAYEAVVKYNTNCYKDAQKFIDSLNYTSPPASIHLVPKCTNDCELPPSKVTKRNNSQKCFKPAEYQCMMRKKKMKVIDSMRFTNDISSSSNPSEIMDPSISVNNSTVGTASSLLEQASSSYIAKDSSPYTSNCQQPKLLPRTSNLPRIPVKITKPRTNPSIQDTSGKILYGHLKPLISVKQVLNELSLDKLQNNPVASGKQASSSYGSRYCKQAQDSERKTSVIRHSSNVIDQASLPEATQPDRPFMEVERNDPPSSHNKTSASADCSSATKQRDVIQPLSKDGHQDSGATKMAATCVEQTIVTEHIAGAESSVIPSSLGIAGGLDQPVDSLHDEPNIDESIADDFSTCDDANELPNSLGANTKEISPTKEMVSEDQNLTEETLAIFATTLINTLKNMKLTSSETCNLAYDLYQMFNKSAKLIESISDSLENLKNVQNCVIEDNLQEVSAHQGLQVSEEKEVAVEEKEISVKDIKEDEKKDTKNSEDDSSRDDKLRLKTRKSLLKTSKKMKKKIRSKRPRRTVAVVEKEISVKDIKEDEKKDTNKKEFKKSDDDDKCSDTSESEDNDDELKDDKNVKKFPVHCRSFVLPPEYDPKDSRWTLKYRENDPALNLVELVPHKNVFVDAIRLAYCKRVSKDYRMLGRMLLMEIFSTNALSVCSLTGARANAFDANGLNVRPGLDEGARDVLLFFVEDYGRQMNWGVFDEQSVINTIRSKIQETRSKLRRESVRKNSV